ncbi:MAG TPA: hypothetical protein GX504_04855 [Clostridia bacterium]|nr:hypothetical protein [Clostridia bacterium]
MRFIGRAAIVAIFLLSSLLYLDWVKEWEGLGTGGLGQYALASLLMVFGSFLLEVPRILSSRGRITLDWFTLVVYVLPGLFLILNPFWNGWGLQVSAKLAAHLGELRLLGSLLVGLGIGKSLVFTTVEYFSYRSW